MLTPPTPDEAPRPATGLGFTVTETARVAEAVCPDPFIASLPRRPLPGGQTCEAPARARDTLRRRRPA